MFKTRHSAFTDRFDAHFHAVSGQNASNYNTNMCRKFQSTDEKQTIVYRFEVHCITAELHDILQICGKR